MMEPEGSQLHKPRKKKRGMRNMISGMVLYDMVEARWRVRGIAALKIPCHTIILSMKTRFLHVKHDEKDMPELVPLLPEL